MLERSRLLYALAWRNLWRNTRRTVLILFAIAFGTWSILAFTALLQAWSASSIDVALQDMTGQGQIHARGYLDDPGAARSMPPAAGKLEAMLDAPAVMHWAPRVTVPSAIQSPYQTMPVTMIGIDPRREHGLSFIASAVHQGKNLAGRESQGLLLGRELAKRLHARVGQRVVLMAQQADGSLAERGFRIIGLFSASPQVEKHDVFVGLDQAQSMLGLGTNITGIAFDLHRLHAVGAYVQRLQQAAPGLDIQTWETLRPMTKAMTQLSDAFIDVWIVIMFVLMAFGIVNTLLMSLHERVRELALLQALGLRPRAVFGQVAIESALVIALGILMGMLLGGLTLLVFHNGLDLGFLARGAEWFGAGRVLYPRFDAVQFLGIGGLVWILGVVASLLPVWRMVRQVPVEAISRSPT